VYLIIYIIYVKRNFMTDITPVTFLCPSQDRAWISNVICRASRGLYLC
jgi:hypothetical protein